MKSRPDSVSRRRFLCTAGVAAAASAVTAHSTAAPLVSEPKKIPFELGLASYTTRQFSLDETIAMAVRLGLKNLCLKSMHLPMDSTAEECAAAAEKCEKAGLNLYGCGVVKMSNEAEVDQAFAYAKAAGMNVIVGVPYPDVLPLVDKKVKEYDIKVAIHNHGPGDKMYPNPESVIEKVKKFDPRIGLCIDIGHTLRIGSDPIVDVVRFADRLHDLHIKDVTAAAPEGKTLQIGRGVIDIPAFLRALVKSGYSGFASFEYEAEGSDPLPGLAESLGYVRGVLDTI
jgi:inosose dehydratase